MVIPLIQVVCGQALGGVSAPPGAACLSVFLGPLSDSIFLQQIIDGFPQQDRLGNAGLLNELHEQLMLVRVEIHGMELSFGFAHASTLTRVSEVVNALFVAAFLDLSAGRLRPVGPGRIGRHIGQSRHSLL